MSVINELDNCLASRTIRKMSIKCNNSVQKYILRQVNYAPKNEKIAEMPFESGPFCLIDIINKIY